MFDVVSELEPVTDRWKFIGLALRLNPGQLKKIEKDNNGIDDCLTEMLTLWLNKNYDTEKYGEPSWELLARSVGHSFGGKNSTLAEDILKKHGGSCIQKCLLASVLTNILLLHLFHLLSVQVVQIVPPPLQLSSWSCPLPSQTMCVCVCVCRFVWYILVVRFSNCL